MTFSQHLERESIITSELLRYNEHPNGEKELQTPVHINEVLTVTIDKVVQGGEGLAKHQSFTIFVPQTMAGDSAEIRIISVKPNYARGLLQKIVTPAEQRVEAPCPVTQQCGGCQWQEMDYAAQLQTKQLLLREALGQIGQISEAVLDQVQQPIIGMSHPFYYRNKAQFPFQKNKQRIQGGFYAPRSHDLVSLDKCLIQNDKINQAFRVVRELLKEYQVSIYDERTQKGFFRQLLVRHAFTTNQTLLGLITTPGKFAQLPSLLVDLQAQIPELVGVVQNINSKPTNTILGLHNQLLWGKEYLIEQIGHLRFQVSLPSFFQINPIQMVPLYNTVLKQAALTGKETVVDAYAGAGTIALWLAQQARQVFGLEVVPAAIQDGLNNVELNGIQNVFFQQGTVEDLLPEILADETVDVVILDPPRKGCEPSIFQALRHHSVPKIIYVSCNPTTLARDSRLLQESGYTLSHLQPVDMFPQTYHLETVAVFKPEEKKS